MKAAEEVLIFTNVVVNEEIHPDMEGLEIGCVMEGKADEYKAFSEPCLYDVGDGAENVYKK